MTIELTISSELRRASAAPLARLVENHFASRLFQQDPTLWGTAAYEEASRRLGWVDPFSESYRVFEETMELRDDLQNRSIDHIVLCGMGGSSLGPEVVAREAGVSLTVVDSTHPAVVRRALDCDLEHTAVVVSSKSGGTLETATHSEFFREAYLAAGLDPKSHIIYVTDPESPFASYAAEGYRVFLADPEVGGRYSALTAFGIVPTVLAGADMSRLLAQAQAARDTLRLDSEENPALRLAATIASGFPERYVLLLDECNADHWGLGEWIEQLIAESTGKEGKGFLPIALATDAHELTHPPVNSLHIAINDESSTTQGIIVTGSLGEQLLLWEVATAALGMLLDINPFDQPDVEAGKIAAHEVLSEGIEVDAGLEQVDDTELVASLQAALPPNGYVAIQAFVDPESSHGDYARQLRNALARSLGAPVALGWGPKYLHSTGQLHKGGPKLGVYLQLIDSALEDLKIPNLDVGLASLLWAQAGGDRNVLETRGRKVLVKRTE